MPDAYDYIDFDIVIGPGEGRSYPVTVYSAAGEARQTMVFPFDDLALENHLLKLQNALLQSGGQRRQALTRNEKAVQDFGRALFDSLLSGEVLNRYDVCLERARQQGSQGLRLKLRIQPPELACLPWEFLFDPRRSEYLCLAANTPLVRYPDLPQIVPPLSITLPLRILGMTASPNNLPRLDVTQEQKRLKRALAGLQARGLVSLTWLKGQTWRDLQAALRRDTWHIFHFIGHGGFDESHQEGFLALCNEGGAARNIGATDLARLLGDHPTMRLALINACEGARASHGDVFSSIAAVLVRRGLPAVLAMQYEITDAAAIEFARTFYESIADGLPVDAAVTESRKAVSIGINNSLEWGTPVLYLRAQNGKLFEWQETKSEKPSHEPAPVDTIPIQATSIGPVSYKEIHAASNLILELTPSPNPAPVDSPVIWMATVRNTGQGSASQLELLHEREFLSKQPFDLPAGAMFQEQFVKKYPQGGDYQETVRLIGLSTPVTVNAAVHIIQPPHFTLTLQPRHEPGRVGVSVDWILTVVNDGGFPLRQISLRHDRNLLADPFDLPIGERKNVGFSREYDKPGLQEEKVVAVAYAGTDDPAGGERLQQAVTSSIQITAAREQALSLAPGVELELVRIPAGGFLMGSDKKKDEAAQDYETPQHTVHLDDYCIGKYPVTNAQYAAFVNATRRKTPQHWKNGQIPEGKENHPVVYVSWDDAVAFCGWASQATGQNVRLPSEPEWEKAARGTDGRIYPWGNEPPDANRCNFNNNIKGVTPVGKYSPQGDSPYGCADMAGNVWEWTSSLYKPYPYRIDDGREDPAADGLRVLRGGSYYDVASDVRCACRFRRLRARDDVGFRVAASAGVPSSLDSENSGL